MHKYGVKCLLEDFLEEHLRRRYLREVAKIWTVCLFLSKGRKKGCPGFTGHFRPLPLSWLFYVTDFKFSHCHFFFKKNILQLLYWAIVREHFFKWADSKWDNIWTTERFESQCELLQYGLWIWLGERTSLDLLPSPHPPQPGHSPLLMEMYWKQVLVRSSLASARIVCVLFSLLDPIGTWIYFSRRGDRFALLAILSGPLWDVCEGSERRVMYHETQ